MDIDSGGGQFEPRLVDLGCDSFLLDRVGKSRHKVGRQPQHHKRHRQRADAHPLSAAVQQQGGCQGKKQDDAQQF